jgi:response regulator RpfG family c-di-GMP phosphodiesterase
MKALAKHTLLVVDDEPDVCDSVHDLLRKEFNVLKAKSATDGLKLMETHEVHIIMTDQRMPQVSGVEMLTKVRAGHPRAVRMLFTGYADLESIIAAINQGHIFKFLKKPWQPDELEAAVRMAADEYERLVDQADEMKVLEQEIERLWQRVASLETEAVRNSGNLCQPPAKHTLLVVDDEPNVCDSVHDLLRKEFRVLKAKSAAEGFKLMETEEVHIIMTDQRMPQVTGVELLSKIRAGHPQAVRMLFTGYADLESVIAAINQGHIFQFLKKPWQPEELESAVRQAANEYNRLLEQANEVRRLQVEINQLRGQVTKLETQVQRRVPVLEHVRK